MKRFDSFFEPLMEEYLSYREKLGYNTQTTLGNLKVFDRYVKMKQCTRRELSPLFFLTMRSDLKYEPRTVNRVMASTRVFFQYLVRREYYRENPVKDVPYLPEWESIPFIFSETEIT